MEPTVRALAGREFGKPCKKYYDDSKVWRLTKSELPGTTTTKR
jgi:hypothetical protein